MLRYVLFWRKSWKGDGKTPKGGEIRMKKFLSLVLALVMTMSLVTVSAGAKDFGDNGDINYKEAVDVMSALEIIDGYSDGDFRPQGTLTRGAAAKIIACMMLGKTTAEALGSQAAPFKDVPAGSTFAGYIAYCVEAGIIDGYADGTFRPSNNLTGFAFLKMLLTALGYDSAVEGFTGTNWTVNVARRAIENGLTDGNDEFVGTKLATREEACLYAVNTIQATLVEYENKGSSITINGVEIVQGASSPKVVTSNSVSQATAINSDAYTGTVSGTGNGPYWTVEFGEKYMTQLTRKTDADEFMRPSNLWTYKGKEIGEYAKTPDLTYTVETTSDTIYRDLGLTSTLTAGVYNNNQSAGALKTDGTLLTYVDGVRSITESVKPLQKSNTTDKFGGQGVLIEVYRSSAIVGDITYPVITICELNTYVGDVTAKVNASSVRDAYVTVVARGELGYPGGTFTTENFAVDDVVIYNYSYKAGESGVQNLTAAEEVEGTLTAFTTGKKATVGGTEYLYNVKIANQPNNTNALKKDVTAVLDFYGNAIDLDAATTTQYAYVLKTGTGNYGWDTGSGTGIYYALQLLLTDGTVVDAELASGVNTSLTNHIVSYEVDSDGKYTVKDLVAGAASDVDISRNDYSMDKLGGRTDYIANGKTIFLVKTMSTNNKAIYNAYNGIAEVPTIVKANAMTAVYCKNAPLATVVFIDATGAQTLSSSTDVILVKGDATIGSTFDSVMGTVWTYDAVVNGQKTTINSTAPVNNWALYDNVSYLTGNENVVSLGTSTNRTGLGYNYATGLIKMSNTVFGFGQADNHSAYYTVADNCTVTLIDENDVITTSVDDGVSTGALQTDPTDHVWYALNGDGLLKAIVVLKQTLNNTGLKVTPTLEGIAGSAVSSFPSGSGTLAAPYVGTYTGNVPNTKGGAAVDLKLDAMSWNGADAGATVTKIADTLPTTYAAADASPKNVTGSVTYMVVSEDGKNTAYYRLDVTLTTAKLNTITVNPVSSTTPADAAHFTAQASATSCLDGTVVTITVKYDGVAVTDDTITVTAAGTTTGSIPVTTGDAGAGVVSGTASERTFTFTVPAGEDVTVSVAVA